MSTVNSASILYFPLCEYARDRGALPVPKPDTIRRYPPAAIGNPTLANPAARDQNVSLVPELTGQSVRSVKAVNWLPIILYKGSLLRSVSVVGC